MRYLRMLTNSLLGGVLGATYLTILLLQLNPQVPLLSPGGWRWFLTLLLFYGVHLAAAFYGLIVLRELVSTRALSPGWASVRLQAWMSAVTAGAAALLMWANLRGFAIVLDAEAARRMLVGSVAMTGSTVVLLAIAVAHYSFGRRGSRVGATLLGLAVLASVLLPLAARGLGRPMPLSARPLAVATSTVGTTGASRVVLFLLDGASLDYLWQRAAEGRFPNFGRILDAGAVIDLATLRPTQPGPVWAAVATGKYPPKNGIRSAATYRPGRGAAVAVDLLPDYCFAHGLVHLGFVVAEPHTSRAWRARPLWDVLGDHGIPVGVVRWPVTYPVQPVRGFLLTDRFHLVVDSPIAVDLEEAAYPSDLVPTAQGAFAQATIDDARPADGGLLSVGDAGPGVTPERWDRAYGRAAQALEHAVGVRFLAVRYEGLDAIGHAYLRYAQPRSFGDVTEQERQRYGHVLDRYYAFIDGEIGSAIERLRPDDLLLVVSGFGMQPVSLGKRLFARALGEPDRTGTHEGAPDGFMLGFGAHVVADKLARGSIVDVAPTVLYFLGLPVGRDVDGFARVDMFTPRFTAERPITFIPSHER